MRFKMAFRLGVTTLVISFFLATVAGAFGVTVKDVDVSDRNIGDIIAIPVEANGLLPEEFAGFQLELEYDPAVLEFQGVKHGALIGMENSAYAVAPYSPKLWALEANVSGGKVRTAGMILMNLNNTQLNLLQLARVSQADGVLINLEFRLLQKVESLVGLSNTVGRNLLAFDTLQPASSPTTPEPDPVLSGGTDLNGLGNWWEQFYLGSLGNDPRGDFDQDGFWNIQEFLGGALPNNNTQAGLGVNLIKTATTGLNLFSIPLAAATIGDTGLTRASDLASALGGDSWVGVIYRWNATTQDWTSHIASQPDLNNFDLEAGMGLMVSVNQNIMAQMRGTPTRFTNYLVKNTDRTSLNILVLPAGLANPPARAADLVTALGGSNLVGVIYKWNAPTQGWVSHIASLPAINNFDLEPGMPLMISVKANIEWPVELDWPQP